VRPDESSVEVLRIAGDRYEPAGYFRAGTALTTPTFPGLAVDDVDEVFAT
jgi:hypothetical protein